MRRVVLGLLLILLALPAYASKDVPFQTITYPEGATPVLRLTFSKFKTLDGGLGKEHPYLTDATAENLSARILNDVNLTLYVFDKTHARIGDGIIYLANVRPGEVVKFQITLNASGVPASVTVVGATPRNTTISVTVNSVPQGATFRLDGKEIGTTPKLVDVNLGKHILEFSKDGYTTGKFPFEMGPRDANGGSVTYELGSSAHDTIELRDGSVLSGDLLSLDATQVQVRIGGNIQTYERNQIKRVLLTQRDPVTQ